jgi:hypothetical protein
LAFNLSLKTNVPEMILIHCLRSKNIERGNCAKKAIAGFYKMKLKNMAGKAEYENSV